MMTIKWAVFFLIASFIVLGSRVVLGQQATTIPAVSYKYTYSPKGLLHTSPGQGSSAYGLSSKEPLFSLTEQRELRYFMTNTQQQEGERLLYRQSDMAFFCRLEVKIENAVKIPVKFRLGDVQYVDYLEGKFEAWRYAY